MDGVFIVRKKEKRKLYFKGCSNNEYASEIDYGMEPAHATINEEQNIRSRLGMQTGRF